MNREHIEISYRKLIGLLSELPRAGGYVNDSRVWGLYNKIVEGLESDSGKKYTEFKLEPRPGDDYIMVDTMRATLSTLIHAVNAEFRLEKSTPTFGGGPSTVITQSNNQDVSVEVVQSLVLDIQAQLVAKEHEYKDGTAEKTFISKVKAGLKTVKSTAELMTLVLTTASTLGLSLHQLAALFT
jgi:hypothetical protein